MILVIGGYAQGKLDYVLGKYRLGEDAVLEGGMLAERADQAGRDSAALWENQKKGADEAARGESGENTRTVVINHLHDWVRRRILDGGRPEEEIWTMVGQSDDCIVICDEVGNGIVPVDAFEREYRERVGRILIGLARRAERVERVICGIGQTIK